MRQRGNFVIAKLRLALSLKICFGKKRIAKV
jgi:hypothetical protein